jgi:hypothetical protein
MDASYINDNIILAIFFIVLSFSFWCLRIFHTKGLELITSRDNFTFFNLVNNYKDNNHRIPKNLNQYIFGKNVYPCFLSWVLSFVPMKYIIKIIDKYFNHFIDYIQFSLLFFIAFFFTKDPLISFFGSILFIISPTFLLYKSRTFLLSSRALGNLLISIFMILSFLFIKYNYTPYAFILVFLVALILLSHRFASQVLFFLSLFLIITYDPTFIIIFIFGIFLAVLLSKGFYIQIFRGHIGQLYYFKKSDNKNDMVRGESEFLKMIKFLINPLKNKEKIKNRIAFGIMYTPTLLFLPYAIYYIVINNISYMHHFSYFLLWSIFCFLLMLFTSFKMTRFLGQQDRYLEYSLIPLAYLSSYVLTYDFSVLTLVLYLLILIISISINLRYYFSNLRKSKDEKIDIYKKSKKELIKFINELPPSRLVTIPLNLSHEIIFLSKHKVLFNAGAMDIGTVKNFIDICPYFPYPDIQKLTKKYQIRYLIIEKNHLEKMENIPETKNILNSIAEFKRIFNNKNYLVCAIGE